VTPLVIYHANCWDGFCAAWLTRKAFGHIEGHAAHYGTPPPEVSGRVVYMLDFSYPREVMNTVATDARRLVVLDHHKTAQSALDGLHEPESGIDVWFDLEKSGGRLTWEWFWDHVFAQQAIDDRFWPLAVRRDRAPWLVDYTEDRDLWRHALPETEAINAALRSHPLDFDLWDQFAQKDPVSTLAYEGRAIRRREQQIVSDHVRNARIENFDGTWTVPIVNATTLFSEIAGELAKGHPFAACYFDRQDGKRQWSLRSADDGVDVSEIAKAHGGGGHTHAAGFEQTCGRSLWEDTA
jgi:oligoribonuclease NrnB/cAMP/cGMP phosphodiesterase (DHH superfamily)